MYGTRRVVMWVPDWSIAALAISVPPGSACITVMRGRVAAATRTAKRMGIRVGMKQGVAEHVCDDLLVLPHDPERDQSAFEVLLGIFDRHFANVYALKPGLAWASMPSYVENENDSIALLQEAVSEETSVECFLGVGNGVAAGISAAKRGKNIASWKTKEFLADIPVSEILQSLYLVGCDSEKKLDVLPTLGISKGKDVYALGEKHLINRFGKEGKALWSIINGIDVAFIETSRDQENIELTHIFEDPVSNIDHVVLEARNIGQQFSDELAYKGVVAQSIEIILVSYNGEQYLRRWSLFDTTNPANITQRVTWQMRAWQDKHMQQLEGDEEDALSSITVRGVDLISQSVTDTMWGSESCSHLVEHTVAQVQMLIGEEGVRQPYLQPGLNPRERIHMRPWGKASMQAKRIDLRRGPWEGAIPDSPVILFDQARQVKLIGVHRDGTWGEVRVGARGLLDGKPEGIIVLESHPELDAGSYLVDSVQGVHVQKGRWWSAEYRSLCYARIITKDRRGFLLVQECGKWYVEGIYAEGALGSSSVRRSVYPFSD